MIVKGIISAIYEDQKQLSVILPEYDNMTTQPLNIYGEPIMSDYAINDFVLVQVFNDDFTDAIVMAETTKIAVDDKMSDESTNPVQNKVAKAYVDKVISEIEFPEMDEDDVASAVENYVGYLFDDFPTEAEIQALPNKSYFSVRGTGTYSSTKVADEELTTYFRTTSWRANALTFTGADGTTTIYVVPINQPVGELYMPNYCIKTGVENAESNSAIMSALSLSAAYGSIFRFPVGNFYFSEPIDIASKHISVIGATDINHKNDAKLGVTFLHFTDLAEGETALKVSQCRLSDFVICGTSEQYSFSVVRENAYTDVSTVNQETIGVKAYGISTTGGMLIRNVGFKNFYLGCYCNNSNVFLDNVTFHICHYGLSIGTDIKVQNISGAQVMVLLQMRNSLCSAIGVRGDSIGQHLVEIQDGKGYTLVDLDADFCMDAIVSIDGDVRDLSISGVHGRSGVRHYYKTGDTEITANDITAETVSEYGVITVKDGASLKGAYITTNQSSGIDSNPFDETINTDTTYEVPYVLLSAGTGTTVKGVHIVTTYFRGDELTEGWTNKRIACFSTLANACDVKVLTSKGYINYTKDNGIVTIVDDAKDIYNRMDKSAFALDGEVVKSVNGNLPDEDGNVVVEEVEPEVVTYTVDELYTYGDTSKKYVLDDGYIYAYRKRFVAGATTPNFTNQLPIALDITDTTKIYNEVGYKENTYVGFDWDNSQYTETEVSGYYSTGLIPISYPADGSDPIIRINAMGCAPNEGRAIFRFGRKDGTGCADLRGTNTTYVLDSILTDGSYDLTGEYSNTVLSNVVMKVNNTVTSDWVLEDLGYVIVTFNNNTGTTPPESMVITVNEEITYTVTQDQWVWEWVSTGEQYYAVDYLAMITALEERIEKLELALVTE